jgi:hypothetical protein
MHKVVFAAALAVGLITAPMSQFVSSAAAKTKKEPRAGQLATRDRQKKCGAEWKEAKASNKVEKGTTWPKFWSEVRRQLTLPQRVKQKRAHKKTEGIGETEISPTPSGSSEPGRPG